MADDTHDTDARAIPSSRPGDRVLRVRTRRHRLPMIERRFGSPLLEGFRLLGEIATQTLLLPILLLLAILVALVPIPVFLFERTVDGARLTSYWVGLWWAVSAFTTVGHSNIELVSTGGRIVGSLYTIAGVGMFFGSVLAAFSAYFTLTWRRPKRQLVDTIVYYLQRVEDLSAEELEELEDMTRGLLVTSRERAEAEGRHSPRERAVPPERGDT